MKNYTAGENLYRCLKGDIYVDLCHIDDECYSSDGHLYQIRTYQNKILATIDFQNGPVLNYGINGITNEALLAIISHRLNLLDEKFPCVENKQAIGSVNNALAILEQRTKDRMQRNVEGQDKA